MYVLGGARSSGGKRAGPTIYELNAHGEQRSVREIPRLVAAGVGITWRAGRRDYLRNVTPSDADNVVEPMSSEPTPSRIVADSEFLAFLWRLVSRRRLKKISGISYLKCLLADSEVRQKEKLFVIVSSDAAKCKAIDYLRERGFPIDPDDCHAAGAAPHEQEHALLFEIEKRRPQHVIIALGGTGQEKLGVYLRDFLLYRPSIHCVGAALGFLTGTEHPIPDWAERRHLGWLSRLVSQPRMFLPRIGIAFILAGMVFKYRSEMPRLKPRWADV